MNIQVNGVNLFYEVCGEGKPLLMVHGNGEDHTIFTEAVQVLSGHYTCYLVDSRGHGNSSPVTEFHYQDMADDMLELLEALDLHDVVYYGFSDGGIIGLLMAIKDSSRLSRMVISGANISVNGVKPALKWMLKIMNVFKKDPKIALMMNELSISEAELGTISIPVHVLAGEKDVIREAETRRIAEAIPQSELQILEGEGHGSYIVHSTRIAGLIMERENR